jgi:hypothetical protein
MDHGTEDLFHGLIIQIHGSMDCRKILVTLSPSNPAEV